MVALPPCLWGPLLDPEEARRPPMAMKVYSDECKADAVALHVSAPGAAYKSIAAARASTGPPCVSGCCGTVNAGAALSGPGREPVQLLQVACRRRGPGHPAAPGPGPGRGWRVCPSVGRTPRSRRSGGMRIRSIKQPSDFAQVRSVLVVEVARAGFSLDCVRRTGGGTSGEGVDGLVQAGAMRPLLDVQRPVHRAPRTQCVVANRILFEWQRVIIWTEIPVRSRA